jgi:chromosome segregation ATPase
MAHDLTIEILKQIRDELVTTRTTLGESIAQTNQRLDQTNHRLSAVEVTLLDLAEQQRFMVRHLGALTTRDRHLEADVDALRARVDKIEARLG